MHCRHDFIDCTQAIRAVLPSTHQDDRILACRRCCKVVIVHADDHQPLGPACLREQVAA